MAFERIRMLRHLFGGAGRELTALDTATSLQGQAELRAMLHDIQEHELSDRQLRELAYSVIDTESTGFSHQEDHLLSIGAVNWDAQKNQEGEGFHTYIALPRGVAIPAVVTDLTGITMDTVASAPPIDRALQAFLQYVEERVIVAHHAAHDLRFLRTALRRSWGVEWQAQVLDTGKWAMCLHAFKKYPNLDMLLSFYEIPVTARHTALGDAQMTAQILRALIDESMANGITTLGALWERLLVLEHKQRNL